MLGTLQSFSTLGLSILHTLHVRRRCLSSGLWRRVDLWVIINISEIEAVCSSETSVSTYKSTRRFDPEDKHRHLHHRKNLRSHASNLVDANTIVPRTIVSKVHDEITRIKNCYQSDFLSKLKIRIYSTIILQSLHASVKCDASFWGKGINCMCLKPKCCI
jgi:hypothetical protein